MWPIVFGAIAAVASVVAISLYNDIVRKRNATANAFAQIDVQLKRRHDLIPNLVEVARRYLVHEAQTLEAVTAARNRAKAARERLENHRTDVSSANELMLAESQLQGSLMQLNAVSEAYPELKADETLRELREELTHTENLIGYSRQAYNDSVLDLNDAVTQFPSLVVARLFGIPTMPMLESTGSTIERAAVQVQL